MQFGLQIFLGDEQNRDHVLPRAITLSYCPACHPYTGIYSGTTDLSAPAMDVVEHTLFICREVNVFKIPPRPAAGGHKSGDWKVADKIFTGRLRVAAIGEVCELRLEDSSR